MNDRADLRGSLVVSMGLLVIALLSTPASPAIEDAATIQPWTQTTKVTPEDASEPGISEPEAGNINPSHAFVHFGSRLDIDGDTLAVSSTVDPCDLASWVYLFERTPQGTWDQTAKLTPSDGRSAGTHFNDRCSGFGHALALDEEAGILVVGNPYYSGEEDFPGAAYIFERTPEGTWAQSQMLSPDVIDDGSSCRCFGWDVALDAQSIVVGAPGEDTALGEDAGAARVYEKASDGSWVLTETFGPERWDDEASCLCFGFSVGVSGGTVAAGSPQANAEAYLSGEGQVGAVYLYDISTPDRRLVAEVVPTGGPISEDPVLVESLCFGMDLSLVDDHLVVGDLCYGSTLAARDMGAAYVYEQGAAGWIHVGLLRPLDHKERMQFGEAVDIDESGDTVVIGARFDGWNAVSPAPIGSAYIFQAVGDMWEQTARVQASDTGPGDWFGDSVGISGGTVAVGAPMDDNRRDGSTYPLDDQGALRHSACTPAGCVGTMDGRNAGSAYIFEANP